MSTGNVETIIPDGNVYELGHDVIILNFDSSFFFFPSFLSPVEKVASAVISLFWCATATCAMFV